MIVNTEFFACLLFSQSFDFQFICQDLNWQTSVCVAITKTCPCKIARIFSVANIENFIRNFFYIFLIFAQNLHCGYMMLEPVLEQK